MAEYKSNSNRSREEETSVTPPERRVKEPVVSGARKRKTGSIKKIVNFFNSEEVTETRSIITGAIDMVQRILDAIDVIMGISKRGGGNRANRVSYRRRYDDRNDAPVERGNQNSKSNVDLGYQDITFDTREEAETVLWQMEELITTFDNVSIGDMLDLCGVSSDYTDFKYGWTDLRGAKVYKVRDNGEIRYALDLPKVTNI